MKFPKEVPELRRKVGVAEAAAKEVSDFASVNFIECSSHIKFAKDTRKLPLTDYVADS